LHSTPKVNSVSLILITKKQYRVIDVVQPGLNLVLSQFPKKTSSIIPIQKVFSFESGDLLIFPTLMQIGIIIKVVNQRPAIVKNIGHVLFSIKRIKVILVFAQHA